MLKKLFILTLFVSAGFSVGAAEYFVAPNGQPTGNGSKDRPWDLQTAINRGSPARGGDTIWMRGGTYYGNYISYLGGAANNHIVLRGYPQEQATIDGANSGLYPLTVDGAWTIYLDFEVIQSSTWVAGAPSPVAIQCVAPNVKLVNLVIHDAGQGIGSWMGAYNCEIYGCIIYNNGVKSLEHGIYIQNDVRNGIKRVHDNIIFNNSGFGVHAYTQGGQISGLDFQGNISFNNGSKNGDSTRYENIFVGGNPPSDQLTVISNFTFTTPGLSRFNIRFSYQNHQDQPQGTILVRDNYIVGGTGFTADDWRQIIFTNNIVASPSQLTHCWPPPGTAIGSYLWNYNQYHGASSFGVASSSYNFSNWRSTTTLDAASTHSTDMPRGAKVFVRANKYEPKRAHIAVYNWDLQPRVNVDVSGVLTVGDRFEVRNAQDYFGAPILAGTYNGNPLSLPATNLSLPLPKGRLVGPQPTGPLFNALVLIGSPGSGTVSTNNTPPTLATVPDQTLNEDTSRSGIPVTVGDAETSAGSLTLSASSADPSLIAQTNITFGGTGANRTMTLTPSPNRSGSTTISVSVTDGGLTTSNSFRVTVNPINDSPWIASVPNQTTRENTPTQGISILFGDPDTALNTLALSASSSNPVLIPNANITFSLRQQATASVTFHPAENQTGTATINLMVSDGAATYTRPLQLTVLPAEITSRNNAPTLNAIAAMTLNEDAGSQVVNLTGISAGAGENQPLTVTVTSSNPALIPMPLVNYLSPSSGGTLTFLPAANANGSANLTVTVNDGQSLNNTISRSFTVTVNPVNDLPAISAIANQATTMGRAVTGIAIAISDPETAAAALTLIGSSSNPTLVPVQNIVFGGTSVNRTLSVTPLAGRSGTATITIQVADANGGTRSVSFTLTVQQANRAPSVTAGPNRLGTVTDPVPLAGATSDDGLPNPVQVSWQMLSGPGSVTFANSNNATTTATFSQVGRYVLTLRANDGALTATATNVVEIGFGMLPNGPRISAVRIDPFDRTRAGIRWETETLADSQVEFGLTTDYGRNGFGNANFSTAHAVLLDGLLPETTYHFRIKTRDAQGLMRVSGDYVFRTPAARVREGYVPANPTPALTTRVQSVNDQPNGRRLVTGFGVAGVTSALQVTIDLQTWVTVAVLPVDATGTVQYEDSNAADFSLRFYRFVDL